VKEYERLKSPKNEGLQGFARIANGAKVIPYDEVIRQIKLVKSRVSEIFDCNLLQIYNV